MNNVKLNEVLDAPMNNVKWDEALDAPMNNVKLNEALDAPMNVWHDFYHRPMWISLLAHVNLQLVLNTTLSPYQLISQIAQIFPSFSLS